MRPIPTDTITRVLHLLDKGESLRAISCQTHISLGKLSDIRSEHRPDAVLQVGGRPRKVDDTTLRRAQRMITSGKVDTATQATRALQDMTNTTFTPQSLRNHLKKSGLKAVVKKKRNFISRQNKIDRLNFAIAHRHWTIDDWRRVVWSDETKINRMGSDGRKWVWKRPGEGLSKRLVDQKVKHGGGSLMLWGCMTYSHGVGTCHKIDGTMDGDVYARIMDRHLPASCKKWRVRLRDVIFQQDNDPKHRSEPAQDWFADHQVNLLPWPSNSPDLNPIEHLWSHLKTRLGEHATYPKGMLELWDRVQDEWQKIPLNVVQNLIESMPDRVEAVIKAKGAWTKY